MAGNSEEKVKQDKGEKDEVLFMQHSQESASLCSINACCIK